MKQMVFLYVMATCTAIVQAYAASSNTYTGKDCVDCL